MLKSLSSRFSFVGFVSNSILQHYTARVAVQERTAIAAQHILFTLNRSHDKATSNTSNPSKTSAAHTAQYDNRTADGGQIKTQAYSLWVLIIV